MRHILLSHDFLPRIGGAHRWVYDVYRKWPERVDALVEDFRQDGQPAAAVQDRFDRRDHGALRIHRGDVRIGNLSFLDPACLRRVSGQRRWMTSISGKEPAVVHCLRSFPEGWSGAAFRAGSRRRHLVTYAHGEELLVARTSRQLKLATRLVLRMSSLVVANSAATRDSVSSLCPGATVRVVHPGVDVESFEFPPDRLARRREAWGWPPGILKMVTLARMEPRKNHLGVLKAMKTMRDEGIPLGYVVAGSGEESARLESAVRELGLSDWVRFCGDLGDEERALTMAAADFHIMPSVQVGPMTEGFGIVFLEAAAAGIPSIAGRVGGQPEAVRDGITGLVVDGSEVEQITNAIRLLFQNVELRHRLGSAGRSWARQNDCSVVSKNIHSLVSDLCAI